MKQDIMIINQELTDINPLTCGHQQCAPGHAFGPGVREYYLLHYVFSGCGVFTSEKHSGRVEAGQLFVIHPGETIRYTADSKTPWDYAWVGFTCAKPPALLRRDVLDAAECGHIFRDLLSSERRTAGREWLICGKIYELLSLLEQIHQPAQRGTEKYVHMALNYIHTNYMQELRVGQLAADLGLERSYFSKLFKHHTQRSPQEYLIDYRLKTAAELLQGQGLRPGEAAVRVGYADLAAFSRIFKQRFGVPPGRYAGQ